MYSNVYDNKFIKLKINNLIRIKNCEFLTVVFSNVY